MGSYHISAGNLRVYLTSLFKFHCSIVNTAFKLQSVIGCRQSIEEALCAKVGSTLLILIDLADI